MPCWTMICLRKDRKPRLRWNIWRATFAWSSYILRNRRVHGVWIMWAAIEKIWLFPGDPFGRTYSYLFLVNHYEDGWNPSYWMGATYSCYMVAVNPCIMLFAHRSIPRVHSNPAWWPHRHWRWASTFNGLSVIGLDRSCKSSDQSKKHLGC